MEFLGHDRNRYEFMGTYHYCKYIIYIYIYIEYIMYIIKFKT